MLCSIELQQFLFVHFDGLFRIKIMIRQNLIDLFQVFDVIRQYDKVRFRFFILLLDLKIILQKQVKMAQVNFLGFHGQAKFFSVQDEIICLQHREHECVSVL